MPATTGLELAQTRGSRLAAPKNARTKRLPGDGPVPVIRDRRRGDTRWSPPPPLMRLEQGDLDDPHRRWWMKRGRTSWREAPVEDAVVRLREATGDGSPTGSVGRSKGVRRIRDVTATGDLLEFRLVERLWDTRL